jgi:hypothetical protein
MFVYSHCIAIKLAGRVGILHVCVFPLYCDNISRLRGDFTCLCIPIVLLYIVGRVGILHVFEGSSWS